MNRRGIRRHRGGDAVPSAQRSDGVGDERYRQFGHARRLNEGMGTLLGRNPPDIGHAKFVGRYAQLFARRESIELRPVAQINSVGNDGDISVGQRTFRLLVEYDNVPRGCECDPIELPTDPCRQRTMARRLRVQFRLCAVRTIGTRQNAAAADASTVLCTCTISKRSSLSSALI